MKKFTKFITLVFAFTMLINFSLNAQHYTDPGGDTLQAQMQIMIYGTFLPGGDSLVAGDEVAIFDGDSFVGCLTLTVSPSVTNWASCQLDAFAFDTLGNTLYGPGNPMIIKCWDVSGNGGAGAEFVAYGSAIDFHDEWYAPTNDDNGPYFPDQGMYSYCFVDLTFSAGPIPLEVTLDVTVLDIAGDTVNGATVTAGGYVGVEPVTPPDSTYTLALFAGDNGDNEDYDYTVTISKATFNTETFDITVNESHTGNYERTVVLDAFGDIDGTVTILNVETLVYDSTANVSVYTIIDGTIYSDLTDADGKYLIEDIPDDTCTFIFTYPTYITEEHDVAIENGVLKTLNIQLDPQPGGIEGDIFDATTMTLINIVDVEIYAADGTGPVLVDTTTSDGTYLLTYYGGTFDIKVSSTGYEDLIINNFVLYPGITKNLNFNLVPNGTTPNFTPITGNPNKMWSIHIQNAFFGINRLLPFDELVIFNTDSAGLTGEPGLRVGTLRLSKTTIPENSGYNVLNAFAELSNGDASFAQGDSLEIWAYDISHDAVYETPLDWAFYSGWGTYSDSTFPDPLGNHISYISIYWSTIPGQLNGTVTDGGANAIEHVNVEAINTYTQLVVDNDSTDGSGNYSMALDVDSYDIRFSKEGWKTEVEENVEIEEGLVKTKNMTLTEQVNATIDYDFSTQGYYFIGRCVEQDPDNMLDLLDNNGNPNPFSTNYQSSWVENDGSVVPAPAANKLEYVPTAWTPVVYDWELLEGYQLYLENSYSFDMTGYLIEPENNPIVFTAAGIYYVPYFPYDTGAPDDAITAFASILNNLDWVMDSEGNRLFINAGIWVDNIGDLSLGEGFKVKMNSAGTLTYPASGAKSAIYKSTMMDPVHFVYNGGNAAEWTYTIYIETEDFEIGDEIAAFSNGVMVGSMVIDSDDPWQNDLNTFNIAVNGGYGVNVPIELIAWDISESKEYAVEFEMININSQCYAGENFPAGLDHFSYANISRGTVSIAENQIDNSVKMYPNPVNRTLNIESVNNINMIYIYNIYGSIVSKINVNGKHQQIDVSNFRTGTYMIQLYTDNGVITNRVVIQ